MDDLRERRADEEHARWARWHRYLVSRCTANPDGSLTIPAWAVERWGRQADTPYAQLSEREKDSDRSEADRTLAIFGRPALMAERR